MEHSDVRDGNPRDLASRGPISGACRGGGKDDDNWELVLFIRHPPQLSDEELQLMGAMNAGEH